MKWIWIGLLLVGCAGTPLPTGLPTEPMAEHHDHAEEGHIPFTSLKQKAAGIAVEAVQFRKFAANFQASGSLTFDKDLQVRVSPRLSGKVMEIRASLGQLVQSGQVLAVLDCPELVRYKADYHEAETNLRLAVQSLERRSNLAVYGDDIHRPLDDAKNEEASARAELRVAEAQLEVHQKALQRAEDLLKDGITSQAQCEQARADYRGSLAQRDLAQQKLRIAREHLSRERRVQSLGLRASKETQEAQAEVDRCREKVEHLREGLQALQADPESHGSLVQIRAPIAGTVSNRPMSLGESVDPEDELFTLVNIERLWLWVSVIESQLSRVKTGQEVEVEVNAFPERKFQGRISYIAPDLDEKTRSARAQVVIQNPTLDLKPAMFAKVRVMIGEQKSLVVPADALQKVQDLDVVYVQSEPEEFERRPVVVGSRSEDWVEIRDGLKAAEKVATRGSFVLKAEDLKSSLEEGGHEH